MNSDRTPRRPAGPGAPRPGLGATIADELRFLKGLVSTPKITGAISPSGAALGRLMASYVDPTVSGPVLELGPGTGSITKALIERGIQPSRIVALEYSPEFATLLAERFPGLRIVTGDAYRLGESLPKTPDEPFIAAVSGIPLLMSPPEDRQRLIEDALDRLRPGAPLVQFSYSLFPPVPAISGRFTVEKSGWVLANLPPARAWIYRRAS